MTGYFSLLKMQLLCRLGAYRPSRLAASENPRKTIGRLLAILLVSASLLFTVVMLEDKMLGVMLQMGIPDLMLGLSVFASMVFTLIIGFFYIMSVLYFSKDATFLAALPVSSRAAFASKLTQVWLGETGVTALILGPMTVLYYIRVGGGIALILRAICVLLFCPMIPVAIVSFISTVLVRVTAKLKRRELVTTIGGFIFIGAWIFIQMSFNNAIPDDASQEYLMAMLSDNRAMLENLTRVFPPAMWGSLGLSGELPMLALFALSSIICVALAVWLVGGAYQRLSLLQGESQTAAVTRRVRGDKYRSYGVLRALHAREWKELLRSSAYAVNSLMTDVMPLMFAIGTYLGVSKSVDVSDVPALVDQIRGALGDPLLLAILAACLCICGGINPASSTAVTREGRNHMLFMMMPVDPYTIVMSKQLMGFEIGGFSSLLCFLFVVIFLPQLWVFAVLALIASLMCGWLSCAGGLLIDMSRPKLNWANETEAIKQGVNPLLGMLVSFGLFVVMGLAGYLMTLVSGDILLIAGVPIALMAILTALSFKLLRWGANTLYLRIEG